MTSGGNYVVEAYEKKISELTARAEKAERELEDCKANVDHLMSDCHRFTDKRLAEFALQQKIEGIEDAINEAETVSGCKRHLPYCFSHLLRRHCDQLRKQLEDE